MRNLSKDFKGHRPMLIAPAQAEAYLQRVGDINIPMEAKMSDMEDMLSAIFGAKPVLEKYPPLAFIPIKGVIGKSLSELESMCGCCDIQDVEEMLEECERDPSIKTIILDIDSPGGTSVGVPELANRIKNSSKEIISFTGSECCSAAYWLGSQASAFYATPSSSVGSIGVYIAFPDCSEAYKMEGVKMDVIKSGTFKGAGIPGTSLDENQRKMLQQEVEDIHTDFKDAVKSVRSFVEDSSMEGQMFSGKRGAEAGLVTSLVNGFDELIESINPAVFTQVEADEENDNSHAVSGLSSVSDEDYEAKAFINAMSAADRALAGLDVKISEEGKDDEDEDEDDEDEKPKSKSEDEKPKDEDDEDEKKSEEGEKDDEKEDDKAEGDEGEEGDESKSEDDDEKPKEEEGDGEKKDDEEGTEPQPDDENEPKEGKSKEDAEDEDDNGEKAVDTDDKHNKSGVKKNRSKRLA